MVSIILYGFASFELYNEKKIIDKIYIYNWVFQESNESLFQTDFSMEFTRRSLPHGVATALQGIFIL